MRQRMIASRRHDASWRLQFAQMANDAHLRGQKRQAARTTPRKPPTTVRLRLAKRQPGDLRHVQLVLAGHAVTHDADRDALAEVLDMVGILPGGALASTYTPKGERRRPTAACPKCKRPCIQVRTDGALAHHTVTSSGPINDDTRCPGGGKPAPDKRTPPAPPAKPAPRTLVATAPTGDPLRDRRAACQDEDPELFFPTTYGPAHDTQVRAAKRVCWDCPLITECLRYALTTGQEHGVWGGTTPDERRKLRKAAA